MNIVLIGMRGSGKSAIGKKISELLLYNFFDLDIELTAETKSSITKMIQEKGWDYFRKKETEICEKIAKKENIVISTGGGIILNAENIKNLKKNGIIIFLKCDLNILEQRIKNSKKKQNRPSLTTKDLTSEIKYIWEERKDKYMNSADITFDVSSQLLDKSKGVQSKAKEIIALIKEKGKNS